MKPARTCVYAISLNEIKHIDKFMSHCGEADLVLVCDTGSTDGTVERLRELGATVHSITQKPWRFDVPRNTALSLIPADIDICLSIDLDEYLQPGWTDALQQAWHQHQGQIDRICYDYIWNWNADGSPGVRFFADKVHHRKNYHWRHPCHETLYYRGTENERRITVEGIKLHHHADNTKSRGQYLGLLKTAVEEDPENDRMAHYYARELMFSAKWTEAVEEFQRHLSLPRATWREERCASMRYLARCFKQLGNVEQATSWALRATQESPGSREPWLDLARIADSARDWETCYWAIKKCLAITQRGRTYMSDSACWGSEPYDIGALAAYYGGLYHQAVELGQQALNFDPDNQRLKINLEFYLDKIVK